MILRILSLLAVRVGTLIEVSVNSKWEGIQQVACTCSFCPWVRCIRELLKREGEEVRNASSSNQLELDVF